MPWDFPTNFVTERLFSKWIF